MISFLNRPHPAHRSSLLVFLGILGCWPAVLRGDGARKPDDLMALNFEWQQAIFETPAAKRLQKEFATQEHRFVQRCLDIANRQPDSVDGLIALKLVACRAPQTEEGKKAAETLVKKAASADLDVL